MAVSSLFSSLKQIIEHVRPMTVSDSPSTLITNKLAFVCIRLLSFLATNKQNHIESGKNCLISFSIQYAQYHHVTKFVTFCTDIAREM